MAGDTRTLKLSILADVDNLTKGLKQGEAQVETFGDKIGKAGKLAGAAFAAAGAAAVAYAGVLLKDGIQSAIADAAAQEKLALTLQNVAGATEATVAATEEYITQTALATGVADDELRPSLERLARATGSVDEAMKAQTLALDIAAGSGKSLEAVSNALGKAYEGNTTALGRLGVGLSSAQLKTMSMDEVTKRLSDTFGGQATARAETFAGKLDRLKVAFDEGKETVGAYILDAIQPLADAFLEDVVPAIDKAGRFFKDELWPKMKAVGAWIIETFGPIWNGLTAAIDKITKAVRNNADEWQPLINVFKAVGGFIADTLAPIFTKTLGNAISFVGDIIGGVITGISKAIGFITEFIEKAVNAAIAGINALISAYNRIPFLGDINALKPIDLNAPTLAAPKISTPTAPSTTIPKTSKTSGTTSGGTTGASTAAKAAAQPGPSLAELTTAYNSVASANRTVTDILADVAKTQAELAAKPQTVIQVTGTVIDPEGAARAIANIVNDSASRTGAYTSWAQARLALGANL